MTVLRTPHELLRAVGALSQDYEDVVPYTDGSVGFSVKRRYPDDSELGRVATRDGKPALVCLLRMVVPPPTAAGGVSAVSVSASPYNVASGGWIGPNPWDHPQLTPDAINRLRRAPIPVPLDFNEEFVWDSAAGRFQDESGEIVTGQDILDYAFALHRLTFSRFFRFRYAIQVAVRSAVQRAVFRGQDGCLWLLEHGYEIRLKGKRERGIFHRYRLNEFERQTDKDGTHFFGFQSSKRAFFANTIVLTVSCVAAYYVIPRFDFLRAVYGNTALSTVALAFGFLMADQAVPFVLKALVCGLSRLRRWAGLRFLSRVSMSGRRS